MFHWETIFRTTFVGQFLCFGFVSMEMTASMRIIDGWLKWSMAHGRYGIDWCSPTDGTNAVCLGGTDDEDTPPSPHASLKVSSRNWGTSQMFACEPIMCWSFASSKSAHINVLVQLNRILIFLFFLLFCLAKTCDAQTLAQKTQPCGRNVYHSANLNASRPLTAIEQKHRIWILKLNVGWFASWASRRRVRVLIELLLSNSGRMMDLMASVSASLSVLFRANAPQPSTIPRLEKIINFECRFD